jgi:NAD(P)-dependent dehydrogenase (short-subunit alcohol dehydrogenase family)
MPRVALITGGAKRIGAAISRRLAEAGYAVGIHYNAAAAEASALVAELVDAGHTAAAFAADLSDADAPAALLAACAGRLGTVTALVNNAAVFRYDTAATFTAADLGYHFGPNLTAPLLLAQHFAAAVGEGAIVNMLDHKVTALNPDFFTYTLTKLALAGATRMQAQWFYPRIRVNGVAPGITLISGKQTAAGFARAWQAPPLGRSSTPEELAEAVLFAIETNSLNGEILVLDGGQNLLARPRDIAFDESSSK